MLAFIPEIGSKMKITKDWTFDLFKEHRNKDIFIADNQNLSLRYGGNIKSCKRTLPAGSEFMVDRIYIRQGAKNFSSVTLLITDTTDKNLTRQGTRQAPFKSKKTHHYGRFWVKLYDFNNAGFEIIKDTTKTDNLPTKPAKGEVMTMGQFRPSSNYPKYWVKFEHPDPELCFDDVVRTRQLHHKTTENPNYNDDRYELTRTNTGISGVKLYVFTPKYYVDSLVPYSWNEKHQNNKKFETVIPNPFLHAFPNASKTDLPDQVIIAHPLQHEINIPRNKKDRLPLGIQNDKYQLENIPVAGGRLTIYKVIEE